ncbi:MULTISPECIES: hypothetical protein [unclassified Mesorhizobium]|uniref:hypothetical protein n=1 Tax=unclassified Mesorhizobium TaxID=325217 RepID=UPI0030147944
MTASLAVAVNLRTAGFARSGSTIFTIMRATSAFDSGAGWNVLEIELQDGKALAEFTGSNIGKKVVISFNGGHLASPFVYEPISDGKLWLSPFEKEELERLVEQLSRKGAALQIEVLPN